MRVMIRSSINGCEYWDTEEKRTIFVPRGIKPDFVVGTPASTINSDGGDVIVSVDQSVEQDKTVIAQIAQKENGELEQMSGEAIEPDEPTVTPDDAFSNMSIKELRAYAKKHKIDIPAAVRTKGDIINILSDAI